MPPLEPFGSLLKAARCARGLTQQRAARVAGVSRRQWALLEAGGNVSVVFLLKVLRSLGLSATFSADGSVDVVSTTDRIDVAPLFRMTDVLALLLQELRTFAMEAALPPSLRGDAAAIDAFVAAHADFPQGQVANVDRALGRIATDLLARTPALPSEKIAKDKSRRKKRA